MDYNFNIHNTTFYKSAVNEKGLPEDLCDVVFTGKSNVGKSSLINKLLNRKKMAHVSSVPGKTATINFYNVDDKFYLVDLPGYGYAQRSKAEQKKWGAMMDSYFQSERDIRLVVSLMDIRHKPTNDDIVMVDYLKGMGFPFIIAATKKDKISAKKASENIEIIRKALKLSEDDLIIPFSSETGDGRDEILDIIDQVISEE
ncbi:MAG: YihA family ribosome biogenesis GTP-binding protein [Clostridia bacterium]|nr:YihA family ribosome biogenesis GTP-binding protein [Clostridia bacterium]